jgi:prepilin-type N-terminal cleavage/methylation domain-containing protein
MDWSIRLVFRGKSRGFSLVEMLVVVGILALLIAVAEPLYHLFEVQNDLQLAATTYSQALDRAQLLSQAVSDDSGWGVLIATSTITVFQGTTYASRNSAYDEQYPFSTSFSVSGLTEVDFAKFTGLPNTSGTTTITTSGFPSKSIVINAKGTATY